MNGPTWSSRSIGSRLQHGIFYLLIRTFGRRTAYGLLFFVALWYTLRPLTRSRSAAYLARRFPQARPWERLGHCFLLNWTFGTTLVDRAAAGILNEFNISASPEDERTLRDIAGEGRGLILLTGHMGCWQTSMIGLDIQDRPVNVVMHRAPGDIDRQHFEHAGHGPSFRIIDPQGYLGGSLDMVEALRRGEILCVMGDRLFGSDRGAVDATFLGGTVSLPVSPYRLASATGAPIIVFFSRRTGPGAAVHEIARVIRVPHGLGRGSDSYRPYAQIFADALEAQTRKVPHQFFNFYNMWKIRNND